MTFNIAHRCTFVLLFFYPFLNSALSTRWRRQRQWNCEAGMGGDGSHRTFLLATYISITVFRSQTLLLPHRRSAGPPRVFCGWSVCYNHEVNSRKRMLWVVTKHRNGAFYLWVPSSISPTPVAPYPSFWGDGSRVYSALNASIYGWLAIDQSRGLKWYIDEALSLFHYIIDWNIVLARPLVRILCKVDNDQVESYFAKEFSL